MFTRKGLTILGLMVVFVVGCQSDTSETVDVPVTVEMEVTRVVEVPNIVEVTRVVEIPAESDVTDPASVFPTLTTDVLTYSSEVNGRDYTVYVTLPFTYGTDDQSYPVLYVTDGDFYTLPTAMAAGQLAFGQEMPEVITVGIGYGGSAMDSLQRREEDMTLEGSESFLRFLQEELIPDIETNYQVDSSVRTLAGHSLGGSFSLYALFNAPDTFGQIIASSPSCGDECSALESAYAEGHDALPVRLYVSAGDLEEEVLPVVDLFGETIQARDYGAFAIEMAILNGETHLSARPRAFTTGMKWVFAGGDA
jgi:predicted alpha/beta superfamily hydrolase